MQETQIWSLVQEDSSRAEQLSPCTTTNEPALLSPWATTTEHPRQPKKKSLLINSFLLFPKPAWLPLRAIGKATRSKDQDPPPPTPFVLQQICVLSANFLFPSPPSPAPSSSSPSLLYLTLWNHCTGLAEQAQTPARLLRNLWAIAHWVYTVPTSSVANICWATEILWVSALRSDGAEGTNFKCWRIR